MVPGFRSRGNALGSDDSLDESPHKNHVGGGTYGQVVQAHRADSVNITTPAPPPQRNLSNVLASVAILAFVAVGSVGISAATGHWPANGGQAQGNSGQAAPSPSKSAEAKTPPAPHTPPAQDGSGADE